jgi:hypothetical protein
LDGKSPGLDAGLDVPSEWENSDARMSNSGPIKVRASVQIINEPPEAS